MKTIHDFQVEEKKVLVRCDLNVPLDKEGKVRDDFRIRKLLPTVEYLIEKNAKIILLTHLGAKKNILTGKGDIPSTKLLVPALERIFGRKISYAKDCGGRDSASQIKRMKPGEIILLENVRKEKGEMENDEHFAEQLARLGDIYINEAFSVCHRAHATVVTLPTLLPSGAGIVLEKEVTVLSQALEKPWRPFVVVIGGSKIETKARLIQKFLDIADHVIVGGEIANAILAGKGMTLGKSIDDEQLRKDIEAIDMTSQKLHLPVDGTVMLEQYLEEEYVRTGAVGSVRSEEKIFDIGPETVHIFSQIIQEAKLIVWSGPMGFFEKEEFEKGTRHVVRELVRNHSAFKVAGGGDTIAAIRTLGAEEKFDHISVGGGAMLSYLAGDSLPGLQALESKE